MFDKKYIAGIASFAGAINNVKAADNKQRVHIIVGGSAYYKDTDATTDIISVTDLDKLFALISDFNELKEGGSSETNKLNFSDSKKNYFIEKVKIGNDETNKLGDDLKIDVSKATGCVEITLVPKRKCIEFKYTGKKVLTKVAEDKLLESVIQGGDLKSIVCTNVFTDQTSKLGGKVISGDDVIGKDDLKLDENNKLKFEIDSDKIDDKSLKTVVCKFAEGVEEKLVKGLDLEELCVAGNALNTKGLTEVFTALNDMELTSEKVKVFFNSSVKTKIKCNGTKGLDDVTNKTDTSDSNFIFIDSIVETDINPIFLKKNFAVEFDDEDDNTKKVPQDILDKIINALNKEFSDKVVITVQNITDKISTVVNSKANDIIVNNAFSDLSKISIEGVNSSTPGNLGNGDRVNAAEIKIKLKAGVFAEGIVKTEIKLDCDLDNVKKGDKKLNEEVKSIILGVLNTPLDKVTPISDIITKLNTALAGKFADVSKKIEATDFDFSNVSTDKSNIKKSGKITINGTFANKLIDDCFETEKEPADDGQNKTSEASKGTNGDSGNKGDGNKDQKGCCGSNKH